MECEICTISFETAIILFDNYLNTLTFLQTHNVIPTVLNCTSCLKPASLNPSKTLWRCQKVHVHNGEKRRCVFKQSITTNTWMANSNLCITTICKIVALYLLIPPPHQTFMQNELHLQPHTVVKWVTHIRKLEHQWCLNQLPQTLGGPGVIVEVDEAKFGHRKYQKGRAIDGDWILGGIERGTGAIFLEKVDNRTQATLMEVLHRRLAPGTIVYSDCWRRYNPLNREGNILI